MSKGRSLNAYINEARDSETTKLLIDLFEYYEFAFSKEIESNSEYASIYRRCKPVVERIRTLLSNSTLPVETLKDKFSNEYISSQIDLMVRMQSENPTEAIGKSKELIESCCKTILENNKVTLDKKWDITRLVDIRDFELRWSKNSRHLLVSQNKTLLWLRRRWAVPRNKK